MTRVVDTNSSGCDSQPELVKVWDPVVRLFHWSLLGLFVLAYVSGDEWKDVHEFAGYSIAVLLTLRIIWGFVGTTHARFSDFMYKPSRIIGFLKDTLTMSARRYLGHNPAGGAMVVAMMLAISGVCLSGHLMTTDALWGVEWIEDVHETAVNLSLMLIVVHVIGVVIASKEHNENLVHSMLTGKKRKDTTND